MPAFNLNDYKTVNERVQEFWVKYPLGRITSALIAIDAPDKPNRMVIIQAQVYADRDPASPPIATGIAKEREGVLQVNKTSFLENCETSAIGRALANLGLSVDKNRPSREEMEAVQRSQEEHSNILDRIRKLGKESAPEVQAKVKENWSAIKEDKLFASTFLEELEEA